MQDDQFSRTSLATAFFRAHHTEQEGEPIFADPLARRLIGEEAYAKLAAHFSQALAQFAPERAAQCPDPASALDLSMRLMGAPAVVLCRTRFAEERLELAMARGVRQYVILGAGMDTFAWRRPDLLAAGLSVLEIDHPATQAFKRQRLEAAGMAIPAGLHFLPVDLSRQGLAEALADSAFDPRTPAVVCWLGVTYYLTRQEVLATLGAIARVAAIGSEAVFDYADAQAQLSQGDAKRRQMLRDRVSRVGEPMRGGLDSASLATDLAGLGLRLEEDWDHEEIKRRYLAGRPDGMRIGGHPHLARVAVA
ncbi:MAG: class I SAM-dependent methyltransferase [Pseudomonadota bacterium]